MSMRYLRVCAIILLITLALPLQCALAESLPAKVSASQMKVYAEKAPHDYIGTLSQGAIVAITDQTDKIAKISYNGRTGLALRSELSEITTAKDVVTSCAIRAYQKPDKGSKYVTLKAGTALSLLSIDGGVATVFRDGKIGYVAAKHLAEREDAAANDASVQTWNQPAVTNCATRIYKQASSSSAYWSVGKGFEVTLAASKGNIAKVVRGSQAGYMSLAHLTLSDGSAAPQQQEEAKAEEKAEAKTTYKLPSNPTNAQIIYAQLVNEMGFNAAAACGILANIKYECDYDPRCGENGSSVYGLVQWYAGRRKVMMDWCTEHNLDYASITGQLKFLAYELKNDYPKVLEYLQKVDNTAQGAYDAAYYFCYYYEIPASKSSQSVKRGNYARDTLFPQYAK